MTQLRPDVRRPVRACVFALSSLAIACVAGACSTKAAGDAGDPCYPNDTCNAGLTCAGGSCVASNGSGGATSSASAGQTSSSASGAGGASASSTSSTTASSTSSGASGSSSSGTTASSSTGTGGASGSSSSSTASSTAASSTSSSTGTGGASGSSSSTTASSSSSGDTGSPVFLDFGTNVTSITAGQSVTFTAVLTDTNGIGSLVGGALSDQNNATYGAFQASGQMGSFQLIVSWAEMNQAGSIDFAYGGNESRTFTAKFFDMNGTSAQMSVAITLTCNGLQAAAGVCYDTMNDPYNCGTVGHSCGGPKCYMGECGMLSACVTSPTTTCDTICQGMGMTCEDACGIYGTVGGTVGTVCGEGDLLGCADPLQGYNPPYLVECCCF